MSGDRKRRSVAAVRKSFGDLLVLDSIDCDFDEGAVTAILGPSGCGKSTLLSVIAGLLPPDSGSRSGFDASRPSFVFQEPRLLPWKTVLGNVALPLVDRLGKDEAETLASEWLDRVGLASFGKTYPSTLSGGMRQRVSLARAFANSGDVLLLDEPFQSLDLPLRLEMLDLVKSLLARESAMTTVFVTHDPEEALYLGDSIVVLSERPARVIRRIDIDSHTRPASYGAPSPMQADLYEAVLGGAKRHALEPIAKE